MKITVAKLVSEFKKGFLKSAIVAIMSASLLGAATYYLVPPGHRPVTFAFALGEGRQFSGNYSTLFGFYLISNFTFLNGSVITRNPIEPIEELAQGKIPYEEYGGEFNATQLQKITISVIQFIGLSDKGTGTFEVVWLQNRTIDVTLVDREITDLGSSRSFGDILYVKSSSAPHVQDETPVYEMPPFFNVTRVERSRTGYWKTARSWKINVNQLGDMLYGSETADIVFTMNINMELKYKVVTTAEGNLTGSTNLSWSGIWGTLQLTHEEDKIFWVSYNFTNVKLIMIVI